MEPIDLIQSFGPKLFAGDLDSLVERYNIPCAIAMGGEHHVLEDRGALVEAMGNLRQLMVARGAVSVEARVQSQVVLHEDQVFLSVWSRYLDAEGSVVDDTLTSYLLRRFGDGWRILTLSIDRSLAGARTLCLAEQAA